MFCRHGTLALAALALLAEARRYDQYSVDTELGRKPEVTSERLQALVTEESLLECATTLQGFAYATVEKNRRSGSKGHVDTVEFLHSQLSKLDYYDVTQQNFSVLLPEFNDANLTVDGERISAFTLTYSPDGRVSAPLVLVDKHGCSLSDYPADVIGNIALIPRGGCTFGIKSVYAGLTGARGAIIYNMSDSGTLQPPRSDGPFVPTIGISSAAGAALVSRVRNGEDVVGDISTFSIIREVFPNNLLATTKEGDQNKILAVGSHSDSVAAGPGINDNGSGVCGILEAAKLLARFKTANAVRFAFWAAEEEGLVGSTYYVANLPREEAGKIKAYLNFDMIASSNYYYGIYDGDGSSFGFVGPPGSGEIEHFFEEYYNEKGLNHTAAPLSGRSDYGPFLTIGIPCGGVFTGADGIKTAQQAAMFGGQAGVAFDPNYHKPGDTVSNLAMGAFLVNAKAIAAAVGTYAMDLSSLGLGDSVGGYGSQRLPRSTRWRDSDRPGAGEGHGGVNELPWR